MVMHSLFIVIFSFVVIYFQTHNELYISYQGGKFFKAIFDSELECAGFHVADATDKRLLVAVAHTATLSNLYVSEVTSSDKYLFRLSLERLFCYLPGTTWKESWLRYSL